MAFGHLPHFFRKSKYFSGRKNVVSKSKSKLKRFIFNKKAVEKFADAAAAPLGE